MPLIPVICPAASADHLTGGGPAGNCLLPDRQHGRQDQREQLVSIFLSVVHLLLQCHAHSDHV